ncbi:ABC transporter substrate-binding protein [Rhodoplanes sp. TEM]|uniref:ABC transporter substrate-binding protein n=1 Tax=Rhodoplanes tepidamans TaxID=200616 RepID=A0ABT5JEI9_RHOTP|nr:MULTISPECIES: ABC transporter substrate-binding protein [Rhodoplanes]MDC7788110.1 ABC transporter substrate-binding protein [Rhodoplanes tepidamans]MDC7984592.1 ABC transporter substrate-binding protein [Rhodoplanes sp. TEM]MDQ0355599.1 iron complex transport system substrate-binding protein [Rhodoplanes tepidamans]
MLCGLAAASGGAVAAFAAGERGPLRRIAALDYGLAETLLLLDVPPVAVVGARNWSRWVVEPALPPDVVDLGSSREPNLELLQQLRLDAILVTPFQAGIVHRLERIAPVLSFPIYVPGGRPLALAEAATVRLAMLSGRDDALGAVTARLEDVFSATRDRLHDERDRPLCLVSFMDGRHVRVYGANSLFQEVLDRVGLVNAYRGRTNFWGFATIGIEALEPVPDARLVYLDPVPAGVLQALATNPLWSRLPFVKAGAVMGLPPVLMFGALPSAMRFAALLGGTLVTEGSRRG